MKHEILYQTISLLRKKEIILRHLNEDSYYKVTAEIPLLFQNWTEEKFRKFLEFIDQEVIYLPNSSTASFYGTKNSLWNYYSYIPLKNIIIIGFLNNYLQLSCINISCLNILLPNFDPLLKHALHPKVGNALQVAILSQSLELVQFVMSKCNTYSVDTIKYALSFCRKFPENTNFLEILKYIVNTIDYTDFTNHDITLIIDLLGESRNIEIIQLLDTVFFHIRSINHLDSLRRYKTINPDAQYKDQMTLLHHLYKSYQISEYPVDPNNPYYLVDKLIKTYHANINIQDKYGCTPLHYYFKDKTIQGMAHFIYIQDARSKDYEIIKANFNICNNKGRLPFHYAVQNPNFSPTDESDRSSYSYLYAFTDYINAQDKKGRTVLHYAIQSNNQAAVKAICDKPYDVSYRRSSILADINLPDNNGYTPLHYAVQNNNISVIKILLAHPKINIRLRDNKGHKAIDYAQNSAVKYILENFENHGTILSSTNIFFNFISSLFKLDKSLPPSNTNQENIPTTPSQSQVIIKPSPLKKARG